MTMRPAEVQSAPDASPAVWPIVFKWTLDEYEALLESGALRAEARPELIKGVITQRMGTGSIHDFVVRKITRLLLNRLGEGHAVGTQSDVSLPPNSRPVPDHWVSRRPDEAHLDATVNAEDLLLVVEVADSSLQQDRVVKLPIYAEAGVPEYWIVNVVARELERYTEPRADGTYARKVVYAASESMPSELLGGEVSLAELLH